MLIFLNLADDYRYDAISKIEAKFFVKWITKVRPALAGCKLARKEMIQQWTDAMAPEELQRISRMSFDSKEFLDLIFNTTDQQ
jgi:hypothetical protein